MRERQTFLYERGLMEFQITEGVQREPFTALLYGPPKVGKSFFANTAPDALFLDTERGTGLLKAKRVALNEGEMLYKAVGWAAKQTAATIVIDSLTAVEKMLAEKVCAENGWKNLETPGFGKGAVALKAEWTRFVRGVGWLKDQGKNVILVAHSRVKPFADPMHESYDRYEPDFHKEATTLITSTVDAILFLRPRTIVKDSEDEKRKLAVGTGRELHTKESPAFIAGNRFSLKPTYLDPGADVWTAMGAPTNETAETPK